MNDISDILTSIRKKNKLTQKQFAERIGLKQNTYSMLENGRNTPKLDTVYKIISEFDLDANVFFEKYKHSIISKDIPIFEIKKGGNEQETINISSKDLDEIIKYKLHYMDFYLLGISYHVRALQEKYLGISFDENHFRVEEIYIKNIQGDILNNKSPVYLSYTAIEKFELIKQLDEAIRQYLDNIWVITNKLVMTLPPGSL